MARSSYWVSHLCFEQCICDVLLILHVGLGELIVSVMADDISGEDGEANVRLVDELRHCCERAYGQIRRCIAIQSSKSRSGHTCILPDGVKQRVGAIWTAAERLRAIGLGTDGVSWIYVRVAHMKNIDCFSCNTVVTRLSKTWPKDIPDGGGATIALAGFGLNHRLSSIWMTGGRSQVFQW